MNNKKKIKKQKRYLRKHGLTGGLPLREKRIIGLIVSLMIIMIIGIPVVCEILKKESLEILK